MRLWLDSSIFVVLIVMILGAAVGALWLLGASLEFDAHAVGMLGWLALFLASPVFRNMQLAIHCDGNASGRQRFWAVVRLMALLMFAALASMLYLAPKFGVMLRIYIIATLIIGGLCWWGVILFLAYRRYRADQKWFARRSDASASEFAAWVAGQSDEGQNRADRRHSVGA
jgi:hypothetical protein